MTKRTYDNHTVIFSDSHASFAQAFALDQAVCRRLSRRWVARGLPLTESLGQAGRQWPSAWSIWEHPSRRICEHPLIGKHHRNAAHSSSWYRWGDYMVGRAAFPLSIASNPLSAMGYEIG